MNPLPASERFQQRRRAVIGAARRLFIERGFHSTGVADLARHSGVAVGQIYRDFASKEEILAAIVKTECREVQLANGLRTAIAEGDVDGVRRWIMHRFSADEDEGDIRLFLEIAAEATRNPRIAEIYDDLRADFECRLIAAVAMLVPAPTSEARRLLLASMIQTLSLGLLTVSVMQSGSRRRWIGTALMEIIDREFRTLAEIHAQDPACQRP